MVRTPPRTVLHVSPHPDDEALGAPATLALLQRHGWTVVNLLVGLGRPAQHERRRAEAVEAARRAGLVLEPVDPPVPLSADDDLGAAQRRTTDAVLLALDRHRPAVVVSPWEHDVHPGHEAVARGVRDALAVRTSPVRWLAWGLWGPLLRPNTYVPVDEDALRRCEHVLAAYRGEVRRAGYDRLLRARATASAVLGSERTFGFGTAAASPLPFAEVLLERWWQGGAEVTSEPHLLDEAVLADGWPPTG